MSLKGFKTIFFPVIIITIVLGAFFAIKRLISDDEYYSPLWGVVFTIVVSLSITSANVPIFNKTKLQFPLRINLFKKIILSFILTSVTASLIITFWVLVFYFRVNHFAQNHDINEIDLKGIIFSNIVIAIIMNFAVGSIWILRYTIIGWKQAFIEAEQFKRKSIESQYSAIVNQINPHFLFNSLNALASLIPQSPEKAVEFVNKFSKIYRYVLDVKDKIVSELKDEIDFLDSYCYLQKIRFGENLIIEKKIDTQSLHYFLPPLSLQLLVENAIKHNEISKAYPLTIIIESNGKYMKVTNNLKLKMDKNEFSGIGLQNLKERYKHLTELKPEFYIKNNEYIAKVPLIVEE